MTEFEDAGADPREIRAIETMEKYSDAVEKTSDYEFKVRSSTGHGFYRVRFHGGEWTCECGDWDERHLPCKHVHAAKRTSIAEPDSFIEVEIDGSSAGPVRDWPSYDAAQQAENVVFDGPLWDLLQEVPDPARPPGRPGPRPIPWRTQLLCAIRKVHLAKASRLARGLLLEIYGNGDGILDYVPNYKVPSRVFNREDTTQVLLELVERTARPLSDLEDQGTVAIDSTGFATTTRSAYCASAHGLPVAHSWVKAHVIVGTKTHIVLGVKITDSHGGDSPQFVPLLAGVIDSGFTPHSVVTDKAYLSRANLDAAIGLGAEPYIPFRSNAQGDARGSRLWARKYHEFQLFREHFEHHYHARSNVEATFSAIKRKLGEPLLSKNPTARVNELLAKLVAYNIGVVIRECFAHGIDPGVPGMREMTIRGHGARVGGSTTDIPSPPGAARGAAAS